MTWSEVLPGVDEMEYNELNAHLWRVLTEMGAIKRVESRGPRPFLVKWLSEAGAEASESADYLAVSPFDLTKRRIADLRSMATQRVEEIFDGAVQVAALEFFDRFWEHIYGTGNIRYR